jgi:hypothetical protein
MIEDQVTRLARIHPIWAPGLTFFSCLTIAVAGITGDWVMLMLCAIAIPLAIAAAIQVSSVAPLATELIRLREEVAELKGRRG